MPAFAAEVPRIVHYDASPNKYFTERANDIRGLYDGFIFQCGSWDSGVATRLGADGAPPTDTVWLPLARENLRALRTAGITENLLNAAFYPEEPWPSPETLLSSEFTTKLQRHFHALGAVAKDTGFRGVCIDVEYPYPRYELDHPIYTYEGYTPADLKNAAYHQGRVVMAAVLDAFPEAVVFVLPGGFRTRPIGRQFQLGMLEEMAARDAPGGMHLGTEYAYCLHDPVTQAAIPRHEDAGMPDLLGPPTLDYWRRRCSMAPGVCPSMMVATDAQDYPFRPIAEELAEMRLQMRILRATTKRYLWSFTAQPFWVVPTPEIREKYGISATYPGVDELIPGWHDILRDPITYDRQLDADPRMLRLFDAIHRFDEQSLSADGLCEAFGTPGSWWVLGPLGNPHLAPERTAAEALDLPVNPRDVYYGLHGPVRWMEWGSRDPRGIVHPRYLADYLHTDDQSAHFSCWVESSRDVNAVIHTGWDDGLVIRLRGEVVFNRATYPPQGHGAFYRGRYQFEETTPVRIPAGRTRLDVTSINARGGWIWAFRITDADGYPIPDIRFTTNN